MKTVIIDFRNICKISSYSILSGSVACSFPTETDEIAARIAKRLYCIRLDHPTARLIFANDKPPYWRTRFLDQWYSDRGLEPVAYKGNRVGMPWPFATSPMEMNAVYDMTLRTMAALLDAEIVEDDGLEADDIWGILAKTAEDETVGISSDSDWRQCCDRLTGISIEDPMTGETHTEKMDIRPKLISGDRGDNVLGCPKLRKDGTDSGKQWGKAGAEKLIARFPETWDEELDAATLERNAHVIILPCPAWNVAEAAAALEIRQPEEIGDHGAMFAQFGLTESTRKLLQDEAERQAWIDRLRAKLQQNEKIVVAEGVA